MFGYVDTLTVTPQVPLQTKHDDSLPLSALTSSTRAIGAGSRDVL